MVNKCIETFLRCICSESPKDRSMWLPLVEWWYNTNYHTSIQATPYEVVYNQPPPLYLPYLPISRRLQKEVLWLKVGFGWNCIHISRRLWGMSLLRKLSSKYAGTFQVLATIGTIAYKLQLPDNVAVHPVFHVSELKTFRGTLAAVAHIPSWFHGQQVSVTWHYSP